MSKATHILVRTIDGKEPYVATVELYGGVLSAKATSPQKAINSCFKQWFDSYWEHVYEQKGEVQMCFAYAWIKRAYETRKDGEKILGKNNKRQHGKK